MCHGYDDDLVYNRELVIMTLFRIRLRVGTRVAGAGRYSLDVLGWVHVGYLRFSQNFSWTTELSSY